MSYGCFNIRCRPRIALMRHRLTLCAVIQLRHSPTLVSPTRRGFRATLIALPAEHSSPQFIRRRGQAAGVARGRDRTGLTDYAVTVPRLPLHMSRPVAHRREVCRALSGAGGRNRTAQDLKGRKSPWTFWNAILGGIARSRHQPPAYCAGRWSSTTFWRGMEKNRLAIAPAPILYQ